MTDSYLLKIGDSEVYISKMKYINSDVFLSVIDDSIVEINQFEIINSSVKFLDHTSLIDLIDSQLLFNNLTIQNFDIKLLYFSRS